jgi:hypothetical protein
MPAGSEPDRVVSLPRTWRPLGPRLAAGVSVGVLLLVVLFLWLGFDAETRASVTPFQRGTVFVLMLLGFVALYALIRSRVDAEMDRLVVVNGYRRHDLEWAEVVAVRMPQGAPWVTLDLADGTTLSALAIQSSDGRRAQVALRELRWLVDRPRPHQD